MKTEAEVYLLKLEQDCLRLIAYPTPLHPKKKKTEKEAKTK